ncbi:MAG: type 4a pilus biogenesis protein PilO, partial [Candidatus Aureabacteria bacterium]|nr:type 4a pilus biogenesis protein PilO [Candidatus Auribacterota bacterium]
KGKDIYRNKLHYEEQRIKMENAYAAIKGLPALTRDLFKLKELVSQQTRLLTRHNEMGSILLLADHAIETIPQLKLISVTPHSNLLSEPFTLGQKIRVHLFPVSIELSGSYQDIASFMDRLMHQDKLVLLNQIFINKQISDPDHLFCEMNVYFLLSTSGQKEGILS